MTNHYLKVDKLQFLTRGWIYQDMEVNHLEEEDQTLTFQGEEDLVEDFSIPWWGVCYQEEEFAEEEWAEAKQIITGNLIQC